MNTAPVYLLRDGKTEGPHTDEDILMMLDEGEIEAGTLASIEGMREWRSVKETLVWSHGALLRDVRAEVGTLAQRLCDLDIDLASARCELANLIGRRGDSEVSDSLGTMLYVNMSLLRKHRLYCQQQDSWSQGGCDMWPAFELSCGKQQFPRDWNAAWTAAGGERMKDRKVALKNAPIWLALSDFGFPFPPLSMDRSVWIEDMPAEEAREFGIEWPSETMEFPPVSEFQVVGIL